MLVESPHFANSEFPSRGAWRLVGHRGASRSSGVGPLGALAPQKMMGTRGWKWWDFSNLMGWKGPFRGWIMLNSIPSIFWRTPILWSRRYGFIKLGNTMVSEDVEWGNGLAAIIGGVAFLGRHSQGYEPPTVILERRPPSTICKKEERATTNDGICPVPIKPGKMQLLKITLFQDNLKVF